MSCQNFSMNQTMHGRLGKESFEQIFDDGKTAL